MLNLIKYFFWTVVILAAAGFVLNYFGYEINKDYFDGTKKQCEEKLRECSNNLIHQGVDNAECDFKCVDPTLIIKKK